MALPCWQSPASIERLRPHLWRYLSAHAARVDLGALLEESWTLPPGDVDRMAATHVAAHRLSEDAFGCAVDLMQRLPTSVHRSQTELRGVVRGPVDWSRTMERRWASGDQTLFVCRPAERRYDTPVARAVRWTFTEIERATRQSGLAPSAALGRQCHARASASREFLRSRKLAGVSDVRSITPAVRTSMTRRYPGVATIFAFLDLARDVLQHQDPDAVRAILEDQLLVPSADRSDVLFELEVGFSIIDCLLQSNFVWATAPGLFGDRRPFAQLASKDSSATIWWQRPIWVTSGSPAQGLLRSTLLAAGMRAASFRPDFVVSLTNPDRLLVVEVKLTSGDGRADERGGVAEVFAYLLDAAELLQAMPPPNGLVVAWNASGSPAPSARVMVADQGGIHDAIQLLLSVAGPS